MGVIYGAYDTKNNEEVAVVGTPKEVAEYFDMTVRSLHCSSCRNHKVQHRYEIVNLFKQKEADYDNSSN